MYLFNDGGTLMTEKHKDFVEYEQLLKNLLQFKGELIGQMNNHVLGQNTQDMLEKLNACLYTKFQK